MAARRSPMRVLMVAAVLLAVAGVCLADTSGFSFSSFSTADADSLDLNGGAYLDDDHNALVLLNGDGAGSAWYATAINSTAGFSVTVNFSVFDLDSESSVVEGLALVVQGQGGTALGSDLAALGYGVAAVNGTGGIVGGVAVEVDLHVDAAMNDPDYRHVSVHAMADGGDELNADEEFSVACSAALNTTSVLPTSESHSLFVEAKAEEEMLLVYLDGQLVVKVEDFELSEHVEDGAELLLGFTAAGSQAAYWITSWSYEVANASAAYPYESMYYSYNSTAAYNSNETPSGVQPLGVFAVAGLVILCVVLSVLIVITTLLSSEDMRTSLMTMVKRKKAPQPYMPLSNDDDYTAALGIN